MIIIWESYLRLYTNAVLVNKSNCLLSIKIKINFLFEYRFCRFCRRSCRLFAVQKICTCNYNSNKLTTTYLPA